MPAYRTAVAGPRAGLVAAAALLGLVTACGADTTGEPAGPQASGAPASSPEAGAAAEPTDPDESAASAESEAGTRIEVRIADREVEPRGSRVAVAVGEPVTVLIDADVPGQMHVHSTPEHEWEFPVGRSRYQLTLNQPGIAEMELHDPAVTVVQLEAR